MTPRDETTPTTPDMRRAWRALCSLDGAHDLPRSIPESADVLTELLFDHVMDFDSPHFLYLLTNLQIDRMDVAARSFCVERALFLDPGLLAEETLCVLFHRTIEGKRIRPFARWAREALEQAANDAVAQPELAQPRDLGRSPRDRRLVRELASSVNSLDESSRRIVWRHLIDGFDAHRIAQDTGLPFERVEFVLEHVVESARKAPSTRKRSSKKRLAGDSDIAD